MRAGILPKDEREEREYYFVGVKLVQKMKGNKCVSNVFFSINHA